MAASASRPSRSVANARLPGGPPFDRVFQSGASAANNLLVIRFISNELDITRWGFAVSRRMAPAVLRNRTRRRLRAAAALLRGPASMDIVVVARKPALTALPSDLVASLSRLLERAAARARP